MTTDAQGVYLSVAANIEPERHILAAIAALQAQLDLRAVSSFYRTPAIGRPEQDDYLNGVARVVTSLTPQALKSDILRPLEATLGRVRTEDSYAARTIDLDMLSYDNVVHSDEALALPDPDILKRPFLSAGLLELDENLVLPGMDGPLKDSVDQAAIAALTIDGAFTRRVKESITP